MGAEGLKTETGCGEVHRHFARTVPLLLAALAEANVLHQKKKLII